MKTCLLSNPRLPKSITLVEYIIYNIGTLICVGVAILTIYLWFGNEMTIAETLFVLSVALFCASGLQFAGAAEFREYSLDNRGIIIRHPYHFWHKQVLYPWETINHLVLRKIYHSKEGDGRIAILCIVGKFPKFLEKSSRTISADTYITFRYKSIITVEYTEERLGEFKQYWKRDIIDYRDCT